MSHLAIAGFGGGYQPRLEINNFVRDDRQFSLYVQALDQMQRDDQSNVASFFQVSGIHGLPWNEWDGAKNATFSADPNDQWAGYCLHGSTLFPTWHRPYVMLIEQILNGYAQQIANTYAVPDKAQWQEAAANLRQPYWDWAAKAVPPDQVISQEQVEITAPDGHRRNVTNPLLRYTFHPIEPSFPGKFKEWKSTVRQPNAVTGKDDVQRLRGALQNTQRGTTKNTYDMFTRVTKWSAFSSHTTGDGGSSSNSVEAIHDNIHVVVGGQGHMSQPSVAGFDPIFYLHHANVDRLISIWSAIHDDAWVEKGDSEAGTFYLHYEDPVDVNTDLTPFWRDQNGFWKSSEVKDTRSLGYIYPEFQGLDMNNKQAVKDSLLKAVDRLYGPGSPPMQRRSSDVLADSASLPAHGYHGHHHGSSSSHRRHHELAQRAKYADMFKGKYSDWTVRVSFKRHELGAGSFSILFFLDEVPQDPQEWLVSPHLVGAHHAFVYDGGDGGSGGLFRSPRMLDMVEEGFVPLNPWIADHSGLGSFEASLVEPFLTDRLQWRVQKTDGTPVEMKSLEVMVLEVPLNWTPGAIIPTAEKAKYHKGITQGKNGGY